ncbi:MAG: efflux RND transporter periplasmic adaptor subunit [Thermomonas sp.]|uniref:efflux RND transporter periplasmic adaptor subunit n=1 Tax=Thermomonas sp. TaxID=1971895 RepID=UPI001EBEBB49|nr:efflux RND transporter periplasmic adaptor subunit [Thermomonas sp.]MBV2209635.1 efflux RND transporter periplasmic adaptor subunit [Thermomonas sp.]
MPKTRFILLPTLLALAACSSDKPVATPALPKDLATFTVEGGSALSGYGWDGVVQAVQRADLAAQTAGRVAEVLVDVNQSVKAGDVLLRITAVEQDAGVNAARAQLRAADASAAEAEQNYKRFAALADAQYVSKAQIDQARAARDSAVAARNAAAAVLAQASQQSGYTVVRAPYAGVVSARSVEPGETVAPGMPLVSLYAPNALRIEVAVPQTRADAIRKNKSAQVLLADGRNITPAEVIVFPAADPQTHSVNVRINLPALTPQVAPGTTAKVLFTADTQAAAAEEGRAAVTIPASSIAQRGELSAVYVVQDGRLLLRQLRLGARNGDQVDVIAGVKAGEIVAADPVAALQAVMAQRKAVEGGRD